MPLPAQLKCSGTLEAVELMQKGYPSRIPYASIHERYKVYMPDFVQALPPSEFVEAIALAWGVQSEDYQLGLHKIFMRAGKVRDARHITPPPLLGGLTRVLWLLSSPLRLRQSYVTRSAAGWPYFSSALLLLG